MWRSLPFLELGHCSLARSCTSLRPHTPAPNRCSSTWRAGGGEEKWRGRAGRLDQNQAKGWQKAQSESDTDRNQANFLFPQGGTLTSTGKKRQQAIKSVKGNFNYLKKLNGHRVCVCLLGSRPAGFNVVSSKTLGLFHYPLTTPHC